jgi:hypothetical protein
MPKLMELAVAHTAEEMKQRVQWFSGVLGFLNSFVGWLGKTQTMFTNIKKNTESEYARLRLTFAREPFKKLQLELHIIRDELIHYNGGLAFAPLDEISVTRAKAGELKALLEQAETAFANLFNEPHNIEQHYKMLSELFKAIKQKFSELNAALGASCDYANEALRTLRQRGISRIAA